MDLEDDNGLDFGNLLEKSLVLIKRRKFLADFMQDKETDLADKCTEPVSTAPNIVQSFKYTAQDLTPTIRLRTNQGGVPSGRIGTMQVRQTEITKPILDHSDCTSSPDSTKDILEDQSAFFLVCWPSDEVLQVHVSSVGILKPFKKNTLPKFEAEAMKNLS